MKNFEENVSILTELGLSSLQAKIYLTLAKSRTLKASEISLSSGVARSDVYRVLVELEKAGLVEVLMHKSKEFHAVSLEKCVFDLLQRRILKTAELQRKVSKLTQDFKRDTVNEEPEEKYQFILISNKNAIYAKSEKMMASVKEQICFLALRRRMITWLSVCLPLLEAALARKVECKMILPKLEPGVEIGKLIRALKSHPNFTLKFITEESKFGFSVWDKKEILLTTLPVDSPVPATTLWSSNRGLVDLCQEHFDCMWNKAEK